MSELDDGCADAKDDATESRAGARIERDCVKAVCFDASNTRTAVGTRALNSVLDVAVWDDNDLAFNDEIADVDADTADDDDEA
jgi:hypothetical protein